MFCCNTSFVSSFCGKFDVGYDFSQHPASLVLLLHLGIVCDGSRSQSHCSQGRNWFEDWGNNRNIISVGAFLIEGLARAFA